MDLANLPERDCYWMQQAIQLAKKAYHYQEVPVGALLVLNNQSSIIKTITADQLIGQGWNQSIILNDPTAHAEINAIRQGAQTKHNYRLTQTTLYVTLEPCLMCVGALIHARISRLVYGAANPAGGAVASQFHALDSLTFNHRIQWEGGCLKEKCSELLKNFFTLQRKNAE